MSETSYTSAALARIVGVSTDTLRHYERKGVLPRPRRRPNGYREYSPAALERLRLIRRALALGFTLDELATILNVRDRGGSPCAEVRELAAAKLAEVENRLVELKSLRKELQTTLREWNSLLVNRKDGERVHLLERLKAAPSGKHKPTKSGKFRRSKNEY